MPRPSPSDVKRFERFVSPEPNSGCWLWTGAGAGKGYGMFRYGGRRPRGALMYAHRFAFSQWKSVIPEGMSVLHRCDVRCCVNPDHLFLGTQADNMRDMTAKGRNKVTNRHLENALKTHCCHGHPLSGGNLWIRADGARICKTCRARIARNFRRKSK